MSRKIIAAFDGGCIRNGKRNAKASYGVFLRTPEEDKRVNGVVNPCKYVYEDEHVTTQMWEPVAPTNNRGEFLGLITALWYLLSERGADITIVSDSTYCLRTMTDWLPNWKKKGTAESRLNYDLIKIADDFLAEVKKNNKVKLQHVRSHQKAPKDTSSDAYVTWYVNDAADKLASELLT
jgi:ribonuclease HI